MKLICAILMLPLLTSCDSLSFVPTITWTKEDGANICIAVKPVEKSAKNP